MWRMWMEGKARGECRASKEEEYEQRNKAREEHHKAAEEEHGGLSKEATRKSSRITTPNDLHTNLHKIG